MAGFDGTIQGWGNHIYPVIHYHNNKNTASYMSHVDDVCTVSSVSFYIILGQVIRTPQSDIYQSHLA